MSNPPRGGCDGDSIGHRSNGTMHPRTGRLMGVEVTPILVALIGGLIMLYLQRIDARRKRDMEAFELKNTREHQANQCGLREIQASVNRVDGKVEQVADSLNEHINWHIETKEGV